MPGWMTRIRPAGTPRATRSSRVLSLMAWNPARRYTRGIGRSASATIAATGNGASWKAVVPKRWGTTAQNGSRVMPAR